MCERVPWIVQDSLWERIEPLLPKVERRRRHPGRKRLDDRLALQGILFVLYTAIPWEFLPQELGFGSGMTCWRRLRDWHQAGVWDRLHQLLLAELPAAGQLDWSKAVIESSHVRALKGGPKTGPSPVDRAKPGSKRHVIAEAGGIPLAVSLTGGHRNDGTQLMPLIKAVPPVRGRVGRPRKRPDCLYADRGYDHDKYRRLAWHTGIKPIIARRGTPHGSGLGIHRWVIERTIALLRWFRRLRVRWEVRDDIHEAFMGGRPSTRERDSGVLRRCSEGSFVG
ncbi:IS5 family transposase [Nonomuraea aurantiaca]|uniref:IS5 family transposase n=1 Tax=Nonomuraea aurantiaca TaxID=2878562 RepID=UPI001CD91FD3|nr:IS5 family transposase [Nonomuraea aurantiaca]MCA2229972.1 IS5 family transposase [Nonomuraea aurantiaca]